MFTTSQVFLLRGRYAQHYVQTHLRLERLDNNSISGKRGRKKKTTPTVEYMPPNKKGKTGTP